MARLGGKSFQRLQQTVRKSERQGGPLGVSTASWPWGRAKGEGIAYPLQITAQVNESGGVAITDASFGIDNVTVDMPKGVTFTTDPIVGYNGYDADGLRFKLEDNAWIILTWSDEVDGGDGGYRVIQGRHPLQITAQVNESGGVAITDASFGIDNVTVDNPSGAVFDTDPTTGYNGAVRFALDDDAWIILSWSDSVNGGDGGYRVIQGDCPA